MKSFWRHKYVGLNKSCEWRKNYQTSLQSRWQEYSTKNTYIGPSIHVQTHKKNKQCMLNQPKKILKNNLLLICPGSKYRLSNLCVSPAKVAKSATPYLGRIRQLSHHGDGCHKNHHWKDSKRVIKSTFKMKKMAHDRFFFRPSLSVVFLLGCSHFLVETWPCFFLNILIWVLTLKSKKHGGLLLWGPPSRQMDFDPWFFHRWDPGTRSIQP